MKKLLVTGASGFLGWNACQMARAEWEVGGTYHSHPIEIPGCRALGVDLRDTRALVRLFAEFEPDAVIHAAAQSKPNYCQMHPEESYQANVVASEAIATLCAEREIPCVFTSTDLVFDGTTPPYQENDPIAPANLYGEQKAIAEEKMLACYPRVAVCRLPLMFGLPSPHAESFIQGFIRSLRAGKAIDLFVDEYRTPIGAGTAVQGLFLALERVEGRLHLGGGERLSRYDFGCLMAEVLELPGELIRACSQKDVPMAAPRPADVSLESTKARSLGYQTPSVREELEALKGKI